MKMAEITDSANDRKMTSIFERYLTVWVGLCIVAGILLGKAVPDFAKTLDGMAIYVNDAPVVSIPIAICLFFMMYPIMVKIDFGEVIKAGKSGKPVFLTLFINWAIKPFTMYAIAILFLGVLFKGFIGPDAMDLVKMPFGLDLPVGRNARGRNSCAGRTASKCWKSPCGEAIWPAAFCWALRPARPWCWSGAIWPKAMTA